MLVGYALQGLGPTDLHRLYPDLSLAQLYDALSYWQDHQEEIDAEIAANAQPPDPSLARRIQEVLNRVEDFQDIILFA